MGIQDAIQLEPFTGKLKRDAADQAFCDCDGLIRRLILNHIQRFGGDWDSLYSECQVAYLKAFTSYDPNRAQFLTYVGVKVKSTLQEDLRRRRLECERKNMRKGIVEEQQGINRDRHQHFQSILDSLTADGHVVFGAIIDCPGEVAE